MHPKNSVKGIGDWVSSIGVRGKIGENEIEVEI
jgi:hypothetical protein